MPKSAETEEGIRQLMKIFQQQYEVQKLPKSNERAEKCKAASQEAERQFNAQAQRMVSNNDEIEETEASQRVATEDSNVRAEAMTRIVSQNDEPDDETAVPIISCTKKKKIGKK